MNAARSRLTPARLALLAALAGAAAYHPLHTVEAAPPDSSAAPSPPASASAAPRRLPLAAYAWPSAPTPEPTEEAWAGATELETFVVDVPGEYFDVPGVACAPRALGSWLRLTCAAPPRPRGFAPLFFGAIWVLAGDTARVKGTFVLAAETEEHKAPSTNPGGELQRKMGAAATITLPVMQGSALLLRLDVIAWDEGYSESNVITVPGMLVDVSWAAGEKSPTISCR
jgi:hypothetical protein